VRRPALAVRSDPALLRSILQNLVSNALRYTERGGVVVGARRRGGEVHLQVWDSGPGISPAEQERVFGAGERGAAAARDATGAGLGLTIVRRLAELLGHRVTLASRPGHGSVFGVVLEGRPAPPPGPGAAPVAPSLLPGVCAAVVDEDLQARATLLELLRSWAVVAVGAPSAREAAAELEARALEPDVLLVDLRLERAAGAVAALRKGVARELPACLLVAEPQPDERAFAAKRRLLVLEKPVEPVRLRAVLLHLLRSASRG
jgi:anti-sigma regulatory factor (Ser/Thr protein kinase)/CheY-like chemotaxis protein